jgi:hypothetical protein
MRLGRPADGFSGQVKYLRYCQKIFIINFEAIFISKIEHIYAIEEGRAGEQSALVSIAN